MTRPRASTTTLGSSGADAAVRRLLDVFGRACKSIALEPAPQKASVWRDTIKPGLLNFYSLCRDAESDATDKLVALVTVHKSMMVSFNREACQSPVGHMLKTCIKRLMLLGGLHSKVYSQLIHKTTISEDMYALLYLLAVILDYPRGIHAYEKMPEPPLPRFDYETLGPLYWHPKIISLACRALVSARDQSSWEAAAMYITSIVRPPEQLSIIFSGSPENWTEAAVGRKQFDAVLTDRACMSTIWELLRSKHFETLALGSKLMFVLVHEPLPAMLEWDHHPHAMANLLSMGGKEPITAALQTALSRLTQFEKEGRSTLPQLQECKEWTIFCSPSVVLAHLLLWINHALSLDWYLRISKKRSERHILCPFAWSEAGCDLPMWEPQMLEAHVLCSLKDLEASIDTETFDFSLYSKSWIPVVASTLSQHAWTLNILVKYTEKIVDLIPTKPPHYMKACRAVFKFVRCMLELEADHPLRRQLPLMRLIKCCTSAYSNCCKELEPFLRVSWPVESEMGERRVLLSCILQELVLILNCILDMPAGQEALAAKAAPATLEKVLLTHRVARKMKLPEPKVTDATRARIEARGSPGQGTGLNPHGSPAQSTGAAGPNSISSSRTNVGRAPAHQSKGSSSSSSSSSMQEKQGGTDAGRHSGRVSSGAQATGGAWPEQGGSSSATKGEGETARGESSPRGKAVSGLPASCAEQGGSSASERASVGEKAAASSVAEGGSFTSEMGSAGDQDGARKAKGPKERTCSACGGKGKMRLCGKCRDATVACYCSEACQLAAWPSHRKVCKPK